MFLGRAAGKPNSSKRKLTIGSTSHPRSIFTRANNLLLAIVNQIRWKWRFHQFGWHSRLGKCDFLTNPKFISIGHRVLIRKGARLEALGGL